MRVRVRVRGISHMRIAKPLYLLSEKVVALMADAGTASQQPCPYSYGDSRTVTVKCMHCETYDVVGTWTMGKAPSIVNKCPARFMLYFSHLMKSMALIIDRVITTDRSCVALIDLITVFQSNGLIN